MSMGVDAAVSLCLDAYFPQKALIRLCTTFTQEFPAVDLRINTQVRSAVSARVLDGSATLGVATPAGLARGLEVQTLSPVAADLARRGPLHQA
ncbi:hypothetical protein JGU66_34740 [Myxococcaceae bacterium JPH2]|nr:hypothetical protein [Myxococcaceae bacterium JPH2]